MKNIFASLLLAVVSLAAVDTQSSAPGKAVGNPSAPMTIEVFSDYQCPGCKALADEVLRPLKTDYVAKGKIYLIHRDFPLQMHPHARQAAAYANAALRMNKYEQVSAEIFRQQSVWSANGQIDAVLTGVLKPDELKKVRSLLNDPKILADIEQDIALGNQNNVRSTPTMIISYKGRQYPVGLVSYGILSKFLDDLLSK